MASNFNIVQPAWPQGSPGYQYDVHGVLIPIPPVANPTQCVPPLPPAAPPPTGAEP